MPRIVLPAGSRDGGEQILCSLLHLALTRHVQFSTHHSHCGWYLAINDQHHQPEVARGSLAVIDAWWVNRSFQP